MATSIDRTQQLAEASAYSRFGSKASLQAAGVPTKQHNVGAKKKAAKKSQPKAPAKTAVAKKSSAKKTSVKKS